MNKSVEALVHRFRDFALIEFVPLQDAEQLAGDGRLTSFPVHHRQDELCLGFRFDWQEHSMAYVTDTHAQPGAGYVEQIRGVDLLLHECYMPDGEPGIAEWIGHSHTTPVAQVAAEAGVGRLVLIHLNALRPHAGEPDLDRAWSIFPNTEVAFDKMEVDF